MKHQKIINLYENEKNYIGNQHGEDFAIFGKKVTTFEEAKRILEFGGKYKVIYKGFKKD